MALTYTGTVIGTLTVLQPREESRDGDLVVVKDEKGRTVYNKFPLQIRESNCLATFLHVTKLEHPKDPSKPWLHSLIMFFADERHLKNCLKDVTFEYLFSGKLQNVKLNIYYKGMQTLAKYLTKDGHNVTCYYKEPKQQKKK